MTRPSRRSYSNGKRSWYSKTKHKKARFTEFKNPTERATMLQYGHQRRKGKFHRGNHRSGYQKTGPLGARLENTPFGWYIIGNAIVSKGTYLYALISGYEFPASKLTISSVMLDDKIYQSSSQSMYVDGMERTLWLPAPLEKFSKELGGKMYGWMNLTMQQNSDAMSQAVYSSTSKNVYLTSQAVSKLSKRTRPISIGRNFCYF